MHIGEVAARTDLSLRSLRHWEEVGLLKPSGRSDGGFRLYTEADVDKILVIRRMKPLGFSLDEMKAVMSDIETLADPAPSPTTKPPRRLRLAATQPEASERREKLVRPARHGGRIHQTGQRPPRLEPRSRQASRIGRDESVTPPRNGQPELPSCHPATHAAGRAARVPLWCCP